MTIDSFIKCYVPSIIIESENDSKSMQSILLLRGEKKEQMVKLLWNNEIKNNELARKYEGGLGMRSI